MCVWEGGSNVHQLLFYFFRLSTYFLLWLLMYHFPCVASFNVLFLFQLRAALYQLHKRGPAAAIQPVRFQDGSEGVYQGKDQVDPRRLSGQQGIPYVFWGNVCVCRLCVHLFLHVCTGMLSCGLAY